jgi:hypothetical protein
VSINHNDWSDTDSENSVEEGDGENPDEIDDLIRDILAATGHQEEAKRLADINTVSDGMG